MNEQAAVASAAAAEWALAEREARRAAVLVATFVGVPAVAAAGAALVVFALAWLVLLAPVAAAVLTWAAWRSARPPLPTARGERGAGVTTNGYGTFAR